MGRCDICDMALFSKYTAKRHMETFHKPKSPDTLLIVQDAPTENANEKELQDTLDTDLSTFFPLNNQFEYKSKSPDNQLIIQDPPTENKNDRAEEEEQLQDLLDTDLSTFFPLWKMEYKCTHPRCPTQTATNDMLKIHFQIEHSENNSDVFNNIICHPCEFCKQLIPLCSYKEHIANVHT
jgi:hypothetical protein